MKIELFKKIKLPNKPGVYFFKQSKEILYIGKATSLKARVKSYFGKDLIEIRGPIILDMVFKTDKIDWQVTDSVLEAIILEANLIKKYQPKYNTKEKSDKSFNYVVITKEKLPKVLVVRERILGNYKGSVFGPFTSGTQLYEALKILRRIFPFLDDKSSNYIEFYKQINLAPDLNDRKLYMQNIRNIKLFFAGKKKQILKNLKKEMKNYAKNREFEKAGEIKRQLFALQHINDVALIKSDLLPTSALRIEAYDVAHMGGKNMVGVMVVLEDGEVVKSEYKKFKIRTQKNTNDTGALAEIIERRFAHREWRYPNLIVVDGGIAQINATKRVLFKMRIKIPTVSVVKDERHKPKAIMGNEKFTLKYKREILLTNSEAHRFAIAYHKNLRNKNFL
jgi:excinuclease ABC subunit C